VSERQYIGAFLLTECDRMCSLFKPVIKLEASVRSNREHFLDSNQQCSSVKPTLARGHHWFDRRYKVKEVQEIKQPGGQIEATTEINQYAQDRT
jgi:hypothetical protein